MMTQDEWEEHKRQKLAEFVVSPGGATRETMVAAGEMMEKACKDAQTAWAESEAKSQTWRDRKPLF